MMPCISGGRKMNSSKPTESAIDCALQIVLWTSRYRENIAECQSNSMEWQQFPSQSSPYPAGFSQRSEWTPWDQILIGYSGCSWWVGSLFSSGGCFCQKSRWTCSSSDTSEKRMSKCIFSFSSHSSSFAKAGLWERKKKSTFKSLAAIIRFRPCKRKIKY